MTHGHDVRRSKLPSEQPPSSLPITPPASEFEFEIEPADPNLGSSCIPPSSLPNLSVARLDPLPIFGGPFPLVRFDRLRDELVVLAPIFADPQDLVDPTELIECTLAPDSLTTPQLVKLILPSVDEACVRACLRRLSCLFHDGVATVWLRTEQPTPGRWVQTV
jgi:hypothetical protein